MPYRAPVAEMRFLLEHVLGAGRLAETDALRRGDARDRRGGARPRPPGSPRTCSRPLRRAGDLDAARLENGVVRTTPGLRRGLPRPRRRRLGRHRRAARARRHGPADDARSPASARCSARREPRALALPAAHARARSRRWTTTPATRSRRSTCRSSSPATWTGTMNLTEPQAGSDVGAVRTRAEPRARRHLRHHRPEDLHLLGRPRRRRERLPPRPRPPARRRRPAPGASRSSSCRSSSPTPPAQPGRAQRRPRVSLEHKLGLHGSPTCVMEYDGATGWLVGEPAPGHGGDVHHDEQRPPRRRRRGPEPGRGRAPGRARLRRRAPPGPHAARRRRDHRRPRRRARGCSRRWPRYRHRPRDLPRLRLLDRHGRPPPARRPGRPAPPSSRPIAKAFGTDTGCEVASLAMQVFGGMGYIEETGIAQYYRDVRVTAIYEGTNGIQAMDLVGRKLADGGAAARALIEEIEETARRRPATSAPRLAAAARRLAEATDWMLAAEPERPLRRRRPLPARLRPHPRRPLPRCKAAAGRGEPARAPPRRLPRPPAPARRSPASATPPCDGAAPLYARRPRRLNARARPPLPLRRAARPRRGAGDRRRHPLDAPARSPFRPDHVNAYALDDGDGWTHRRHRPRHPRRARGLGARPRRAARRPPGPPRHRSPTTTPTTSASPAGSRRAGAELWTTRTAWLLARMLTLDVQERPTPEMLAFWRARRHARRHCCAERARGRPFNFADAVRPLPLGYRRIVQGEEIDAGGRRWRVEIGHGHAPEQATLWGVGHDLVLTGDQVLPGITPNIGVYATEPEADPVGDWLASCARLARARAPRPPGPARPPPALPRPRRGSPTSPATRRRRSTGSRPTSPTPRRGDRLLRGRSSAAASRRRIRASRSPRPSPTSTTCAPPAGRGGAPGRTAPGSGRRGDFAPDSAAASG